MTDVMLLATETVKALMFALPAAKLMAGKAEEGFATEAGKSLLAWLTEKMTTPVAKETLARALQNPEKQRNLSALEGEIAGLAEDEPEFRRELEERLRAGGISLDSRSQTATATGDGNSQIQISGSHNSVS